MSTSRPWQISVDTGGTFTDCIAYDPNGKVYRAKVLSNSSVRGRIIKQIGTNKWQVELPWHSEKDIFKDYSCRIHADESLVFPVVSLDTEKKELSLAGKNFPDLYGKDFELTAGEEAPILAARWVTQTPLFQPLPFIEMRLGSTKGTNALLERKGAKVVGLITRGFKDLLAIGTQQRPDIFALKIEKPTPFYEKMIEVEERISADGKVWIPLSENEIQRLVTAVTDADCDAVAISLMHAYLNPVHEKRLKDALIKAGISFISCSAELSPTINMLDRSQTAIVNAYLSPVIETYLSQVRKALPVGSLKVMTSAGGLIDADFFSPKDSLLSGPAGGIVGAANVAKKVSTGDILTLDMGGTSTDVARYTGTYSYQYELTVGDAKLTSPALMIETVAAGGGSICKYDGHRLTVGPESAGAFPGPACYGVGGPLTLTDVNLLMGRIDAQTFGIPLDKEASENSLNEVARMTGMSTNELLDGFLQIANEKMAGAIRNISVSKGYDPETHALLAFGGAGGQHACGVAELLNIKEVLIPYDAGILSAVGISKAAIERFSIRQVLKPFEEENQDWKKALIEVEAEALDAIKKEINDGDSALIKSRHLSLRLKGQSYAHAITYFPGMKVIPAFKKNYEEIFGYWLEGQVIELESIKVVAACENPSKDIEFSKGEEYVPQPNRRINEVEVYQWEELKSGAFISGPSLLVSQTSTTYIPSGWELSLPMEDVARIIQVEKPESIQQEMHEAVQLELFINRFRAIADEMGALLERTSFSVNIKERLDFSCALLDSKGELVVNAPHIPVHLGSLGVCVRLVQEVLPMEDGDIVITNHPGYGGSHLPDITLISPVFVNGERIGYVANRAHHAELGGKSPGSMPPDATCLAEEGVVIPPIFLMRKGEIDWGGIKRILLEAPFPTRALNENIADLQAGFASIRVGVTALQTLCHHFGNATIPKYMAALKAYSKASFTESLKAFSRGKYKATQLLDDGSPLVACLDIQGERIDIDFSGSAGIHPGNLNANPAIVNSAVIYVLRLLIPLPIPLNEGILQTVRIHVPSGILNPDFPADPMFCPAVVGGNVETSQRLVDTLLKALGIIACSQGTMNNLLFGNAHFGYYETIGGGTGAGRGFNGTDAIHHHMTNTRITDPEILETRYPVRLERFEIRKNSGGAGKWKGGNGIIRQITFLEPVTLTLLSQHRIEAPYGLEGGESGKTGIQFFLKKNGEKTPINGIDQLKILPGEGILIKTPGGGGFG